MAGWVIGRLKGIGKFLTGGGAEAAFRKSSVGRAFIKSGYTTSKLGEAVSKWAIYISAIFLALRSTGVELITAYADIVISYIPQFIGAIIIVLIGFTLSEWFAEYIKHSVSTEEREILFVRIAADFLKFIFYIIVITIALNHLGIDTTIIIVFANALAWSLAIAVGVATGIVVGWLLKDRVKEWLSRM